MPDDDSRGPVRVRQLARIGSLRLELTRQPLPDACRFDAIGWRVVRDDGAVLDANVGWVVERPAIVSGINAVCRIAGVG